jgi:hypothetical protein
VHVQEFFQTPVMGVEIGLSITIADVRRHAQELVDTILFTTLHTVDTLLQAVAAVAAVAAIPAVAAVAVVVHVVPAAAVVVLDALTSREMAR